MKYILLILLITTTPCQADGEFIVNAVAYDGQPNISLAIDNTNTAYIAYLSNSDDWKGIKLAKAFDNGYQYEMVTDVTLHEIPLPIFSCSLAIDNFEGYGIAFTDSEGLKFAYKTAWADWKTVTIDHDGYNNVSMVFSENGIPHIAYNDLDNAVKYATYDIQSCSWKITHLLNQNGTINSIASSNDNKIAIAWHQDTNGINVVLKTADSPSWQICPNVPNGHNASLAFTPSGDTAMAYIDDNKLIYSILYAGWLTTTIDDASKGNAKEPVSLCIGNNGNPGIAYIHNEKPAFASPTGPWQTVKIDNESDPIGLQLCFDNNNKPLIAYYDDSTGREGKTVKLTGTALLANSIADINNDGSVDLIDFAQFTSQWMSMDIETPANFNGSSPVDIEDLCIFSKYWLWQR